MKAELKTDEKGSVLLTLIAETDVEQVELQHFRYSMRDEDQIITRGRFFFEGGGSTTSKGDTSFTLRSYVKDDEKAKLGITQRLKTDHKGRVTSPFKIKKVKIDA